MRCPRRRKQHPAVVIPAGAIAALIVLLLPLGFTGFIPSVIALIALYALMGLGLNITLGLAGLLDLGFVAFFAVGAYTVGAADRARASSASPHWPFFVAIPFAILAAMGFGILLGLPILGIRGDYLAIATLGFGEIIAILARSDLLKAVHRRPARHPQHPQAAGFDGHRHPARPLAGGTQPDLLHLARSASPVIAFIAIRLRDSRLGRAWMAIREDEDVAEALGINLVQTKSLAYMLGAAFAGLGGAIFAALFGSIHLELHQPQRVHPHRGHHHHRRHGQHPRRRPRRHRHHRPARAVPRVRRVPLPALRHRPHPGHAAGDRRA